MSGRDLVQLAFVALVLVLPVLALRGQNIDWAKGWRMAAIWIAMFLLVALVFTRMGL